MKGLNDGVNDIAGGECWLLVLRAQQTCSQRTFESPQKFLPLFQGRPGYVRRFRVRGDVGRSHLLYYFVSGAPRYANRCSALMFAQITTFSSVPRIAEPPQVRWNSIAIYLSSGTLICET